MSPFTLLVYQENIFCNMAYRTATFTSKSNIAASCSNWNFKCKIFKCPLFQLNIILILKAMLYQMFIHVIKVSWIKSIWKSIGHLWKKSFAIFFSDNPCIFSYVEMYQFTVCCFNVSIFVNHNRAYPMLMTESLCFFILKCCKTRWILLTYVIGDLLI